MDIKTKTLANGLNTLFVNSPGSSLSSIQIWFRAGSALEDSSNLGIAHFLEHMFFKGTDIRPGAKIAYDVESMGGEINAFTSFDFTCYYINTPNKSLKKSMEILLDMVSNPKFDYSEIPPERNVVLEEYNRSQDSPSQFSFQKIQNNCFSEEYSHPILGNIDTIRNFSRKQLIAFRKKHYNLSNALFLIAGDLKQQKDLEKVIEKYKIPNGSKTIFPKFYLKSKTHINLHKKNVAMATLNITLESTKFISENAPSEDLAVSTLGYGETSRLYTNLVLKSSLANSSSSSTMFMANGGTHFVKVVFPLENLSKIITNLCSTLSEIYEEGFNDDEINRMRNQYIASKVYEKESIESFSFTK